MRIILFLFAALLLMASCRSTKKITSVVSKKDSSVLVVRPEDSDSAKHVKATFESINSRQIRFNTFSSKVKIDYSDDKNNKIDVNAFLRMKRDSAIWISIIAAFNIEAFRVLITPDSIFIMDKISRTIQRKPLSYLQQISKVPFDFKTLQDLIVGNPVYLEKNITSYVEQGETVSMSLIGAAFKHYITVGKQDLNVLFSKLDDVDLARSRTANLSYAGYIPLGKWKFSESRKIVLTEKTKIDLELEFKQVEFDQLVGFPFSVPKNYKAKL
jgi:hypothetical protein